MNLKVEEIKSTASHKQYKVKLNYEEIERSIDKKVEEKAKTFKMPGFREGTVPKSIVRQKLYNDLLKSEINSKVPEAIKYLVDNNNFVPMKRPDVQIEAYDKEQGLVISISADVVPETPEVDWKNIEIEKINVKPSQEELEIIKSNVLAEFRGFSEAPKKHKVKLTDKVNLDFYGKIDGKDFDGNKDTGMELTVGEDKFLKDFEDALIGMETGEEKSFDVIFPKDYPNEQLIGKKAVFNVKINSIKTLEEIKEITKEMLNKLGVESEEKLIEFLKKKLEFDFASASRMKMKKDLFDILDKDYDFEVSKNIIEQDLESMIQDLKKNRPNDIKDKSDEQIRKEYFNIAKRRVKIALFISNIARKNNIITSDDELQKMVDIQASSNPNMKNKIIDFYKDRNNLEKLRGPLLEEKVIDWILKKVKIKDVQMDSSKFKKDIMPLIR